jgi:hypothetical protein
LIVKIDEESHQLVHGWVLDSIPLGDPFKADAKNRGRTHFITG